MAERSYWRVNNKVRGQPKAAGTADPQKMQSSVCCHVQWEVPPDYINVILGIKDNLTKDLVYILMAKGLHCISIKVRTYL